MARTILNEVLPVNPENNEHQLAHTVRDRSERAYNRTKHLPERRKMMQQRADDPDGLKTGTTVESFRRPASASPDLFVYGGQLLMKRFIAVMLIALWSAQVSAQSRDGICEVTRQPFVQGGTSSAAMVMVNDGKPCKFRFRFRGEYPPDSWDLVTKPQSGTVQFGEDAAEYQPNPGFTGTDKFVVAIFGRVRSAMKYETPNGRFEITVTVNPKP